MWRVLRNRRLNGHKFTRQTPTGPHFADFACRAKKLIVEVDGATHGSEAECTNDDARTAALAELGYRVIRFTNDEVLGNIDGVLETILHALEQRSLD